MRDYYYYYYYYYYYGTPGKWKVAVKPGVCVCVCVCVCGVDQEQVPVAVCRTLSIGSVQRRRGLIDLQADYANVATKTFRFPVSAADDQQLVVLEYCGESRLTYSLPAQLL